MVIFIDESGIHKSVDHSAFSMAYIEFENVAAVEKGIVEIEKKHNLRRFKWTDLPWKLRGAFLSDVAQLPFKAKVAIFENPIKPDQALEWSAQHLLIEKDFKAIYIDGKKPRWVELRLKKVLRDKGISVKKLKTLRHDSSPGVRLADALAGLARSYYDNPDGKAKPLWEKIKHKITAQLVGGQADE
jgi:hypothetical protein